jgi:hypothetical protein
MSLLNKKQKDLLNLIRQDLKEATTSSTSSGKITVPLSPGIRLFNKEQLQPFVVPTSHYDDAELSYDSYDGSLDVSKSKAEKMEKKARKIAKYIKNHPSDNDEDGGILNQYSGKVNESKNDEINEILITISPIIKKLINSERNRIMSNGNWMDESRIEKIILKKILSGDDKILDKLYDKSVGSHMRNEINRLRKIINDTSLNEISTSEYSGEYNGPIELGLKKWRESELKPFTNFSNRPVNEKNKKKTLKNNIKRNVGVWEKGIDGKYEIPTHDVHTIKEDLAVWFGTKKKSKGSKQPKGPWVNICRKVDGKHPPCGRHEASDKGYPKCRAASVAGKMSDSQKKAACAKKRRDEKTHSKSGTGNKPKMSSYKPRKEEKIDEIVNKVLNRINNVL